MKKLEAQPRRILWKACGMTRMGEMAKQNTFQRWVADGEADAMLALIQSLSMQGFTIANIAKEIGVGTRTLMTMQKNYSAVSTAIKNGRRFVVAMCQNKLMDKIQMGDTTAIIYALKVYGGDFFHTDNVKLASEVTGRNGQPIELTGAPQIYLPQKDESDEE